jgi:hypothetical protein
VQTFEEVIQEALEGLCTAVEHAYTAGCTIDLQQGWQEFLDEMPRGFHTCATDTASMEWKEVAKVERPAPSHGEGKSGCHLFLTACMMLELEIATTQERVQEVIGGKLTECSVLQASELVGHVCTGLSRSHQQLHQVCNGEVLQLWKCYKLHEDKVCQTARVIHPKLILEHRS